MATLERLLRKTASRYLPFSQPRYTGTYPLGSGRRGPLVTTSSNSRQLPSIYKYKLSSPKSKLAVYEDRRLFHPLGVNRPLRSKVEFVTSLKKRPYQDPTFDPRGVPQKLVPSRTDPSGWTYIEDRPGVLGKARMDPWGYGVSNPYKVIICLKRKMRKEIMHAMGVAGSSDLKKPKFGPTSYVKCF